MTATMNSTQNEQGLHIERSIEIKASPRIVFDSLLEQLGPRSAGEDGKSMHMKFEAWPGGRWYRDLGNNAGHLWGHVQVIKPPMLLELTGPLFMSFAATNHVQYRLTENGAGTRLKIVHTAMGDIPAEQREGVGMGWAEELEAIRALAESKRQG